jgi:hypothetical protein
MDAIHFTDDALEQSSVTERKGLHYKFLATICGLKLKHIRSPSLLRINTTNRSKET